MILTFISVHHECCYKLHLKVSFNLVKVVSHYHKWSAKMSDNLKDISSALDTQKVRGAAAVDDKLTVVIS